MTVTIELKPEVETLVAARAAAPVVEYIERVIENYALRPTLDEILAPVRLEFQESGTSEDDLDGFIEDECREIREERHGGRA